MLVIFTTIVEKSIFTS